MEKLLCLKVQLKKLGTRLEYLWFIGRAVTWGSAALGRVKKCRPPQAMGERKVKPFRAELFHNNASSGWS